MAVAKKKTKAGTVFYEVRWAENNERKGKSFDRKIDADQFDRQKKLDLQRRELHVGWNQHFSEVAAQWTVRQKQGGHSSGWMRKIALVVNSRLSRHFGEVFIKDINPTLVEKWVGKLLDQGMSPANLNEHIKMLKAVLNYEVTMGRIPYNPIGRYQMLKKPMIEFTIWEREDVSKFLQFMREKYKERNLWVYRSYVVALNTGVRAGELWGLRWSDIMWKDRLIKIEQTCDGITRTLKIGTKSKKMRFVPLTDAALEVLEEERRVRKDLSCTLVFPCGSRPVLHDNFRRDHWEKDIKFAAKTLGIKRIRFHDLRHTAATLLLQTGLDVTEVQQVLGHASVTTTMRYVHLIGNRSAAKASKIFNVSASIAESSVQKVMELSEISGTH